MSATPGALALIIEPALRDEVDRVAAAAGLPVVHVSEPSGGKAWTAAAVVLLDAPAARRCAELALPRRAGVVMVGHGAAEAVDWEAALLVGAEIVLTLPGQDDRLIAVLSDAAEDAETSRAGGPRGPVVAVLGGRGGAGASVFATALATVSLEALLVDVDPWGGGIDLVVGSEREGGLRWPDLAAQGGRLSYPALRAALPRRGPVTVLSCGRSGGDISPAPLAAVIDAGCRAGATVVCDLPRRDTPAAETALDAADLIVVVTVADVRSCAAGVAVARWASAINPNVGLVVRGPAPGGLRSGEVARMVGVPLLAGMRPERGITEALERGGLRLRRRSALTIAAREVLGVLPQQPAVGPAVEAA